MFEPSKCLNREQLDGYVENTLSTDERHLVEKHLIDCELCSNAVEGRALEPSSYKSRENLQLLRENFTRPAPSFKRHYKVAVAVLMILLPTFYWANKQSTGEELFAQHFEPYPNKIYLTRAGETQDERPDALEVAMFEYEGMNYRSSLEAFETLLQSDPDNLVIHFYAAMANFCLGKTNAAVSHLHEVASNDTSQFYQHANWYLALALLKANDLNKAKEKLNEIRSTQYLYQERSETILAMLSDAE